MYSAAHHLAVSRGARRLAGAIFTYDHSSAYVQQVLSLAAGYHTQGLTAQGSGGSATPPELGRVTGGRPFAVRPASSGPAESITLAQGQPMIVAATFFTDDTRRVER